MTRDEVIAALKAELALERAGVARVSGLEADLATAKQQVLDSAARVKTLRDQFMSVLEQEDTARPDLATAKAAAKGARPSRGGET